MTTHTMDCSEIYPPIALFDCADLLEGVVYDANDKAGTVEVTGTDQQIDDLYNVLNLLIEVKNSEDGPRVFRVAQVKDLFTAEEMATLKGQFYPALPEDCQQILDEVV